MKNNRLLFILIGFFLSPEFLITLLVPITSYFLFSQFTHLGWNIINSDSPELIKILILAPLGTLAYVAKTGRELWLPGGKMLPHKVMQWENAKSIKDFMLIACTWALINVIIATPVFAMPRMFHSGRFFMVLVWSLLLSIFQVSNIYINEIKIKEFLD